MLIIFKSPADGDVVMFEKNARQLIGVLGKDADATRGVVTVVQLPGAIAALDIAMAADRETQRVQAKPDDEDEDRPDGGVSFCQRAVPLRELLERSLKDKVPVTWGV